MSQTIINQIEKYAVDFVAEAELRKFFVSKIQRIMEQWIGDLEDTGLLTIISYGWVHSNEYHITYAPNGSSAVTTKMIFSHIRINKPNDPNAAYDRAMKGI